MADRDMTDVDAAIAHYEEMSRAALAAMGSFAQLAQKLAAREVEERSPDGRVIVKANAGGAVTAITLRRGALRRYDRLALGEIVTQTLQAAQRRARREYETALRAAIPPEVIESARLIDDTARG